MNRIRDELEQERIASVFILEALLRIPGIEVNVKNNKGYTSLAMAEEKKCIDIIGLLSHYVHLYLHNFVKEGKFSTLENLNLNENTLLNKKNSEGKTLLHITVEEKNTEIVKLLLSCAKIDIGIENSEGYTALQYAQRSGHVEIIKLLEKEAEKRRDASNIQASENEGPFVKRD